MFAFSRCIFTLISEHEGTDQETSPEESPSSPNDSPGSPRESPDTEKTPDATVSFGEDQPSIPTSPTTDLPTERSQEATTEGLYILYYRTFS